MSQIPWAGILKDLSEALERELEAALRLARRAASLEATREPHAITLTLQVRTGGPERAPAAARPSSELDQLRTERDRTLVMLEGALAEKRSLEARMAGAEQSRKSAESSLRRLKARVKELETAARVMQAPAPAGRRDDQELRELRSALDALRSQLKQERIARSAAEATLAFAERERARLQEQLEGARQEREASEEALLETRRLADDLQTELGELWRVLRDTRPGEPLAINLNLSDSAMRQGVERVQAKIIDARELFKRRNHRWPIAM